MDDEFNPAQPFFSVVIAWIRLPSLPGYMYKRKILLEIGGMVGSITKLNLNTNSRTKGHFARMVVYVSLIKPLISKVLINGKPQRVENAKMEAPQIVSKLEELKTAHKGSDVEEGPYRPRMLVEQKVRCRSKGNKVTSVGNPENTLVGSRFMALFSLDKDIEEFDLKNREQEAPKIKIWKNKSVGIKDAARPSGKWHKLGLGCVGYFDPKEQMKVTFEKRNG
ncbi:hypothetical protein Golob_026430, partial [Gossypium lobatum]|nr:hypothetical protein [Gossypium lobatum]